MTTAAYANAFGAGFALDNRQLILNDPRVHSWSSANLSLIASHTYWWPYGESGLYRPLTTLSYLLNYALLGNAASPAGYHAFNLLLHVANVLLLWRLISRVAGQQWVATAAAAIWSVVPLSTEAVTNIVGRADLLAAAFSLSALLMYCGGRHDDDRRRAISTSAVTRRANGVTRAAIVALLVLGGALSKESAVAVVGVLLLYELLWWSRTNSMTRLITTLLACAIVLTPLALQRASVIGASKAAEFPFTDNPIVGASFWQGRLTALQVMWRYLMLLAWPARLSNDYSYAQIPLATGSVGEWFAVVLLVGGLLGLFWELRHNRAVLFFAGFGFLMFLPASNLLFATGTIMGERLMYLPSAGLAALAAVGLRSLTAGIEPSASTPPPLPARSGFPVRLFATTIVSVIVVAYGARTLARNRDWLDDVTLWRSATDAAPKSAKAHSGLADALYDVDQGHSHIDDVIAEADRAAALLEPVSDERNSFHVFRQAGAFYLDKAERMTASTPRNTVNPDLRRLYARAIHLLDRAVLITRAQAGGVPGLSDQPEADAQRLRAVALLALENPSLALIASDRARTLSPLQPLAYRTAASALIGLNRDDDAAIALLTGSIVTGDRSLGDACIDLYQHGLDPDGCAVSMSGGRPALNPRCPVVHRHSCTATAEAIRIDSRLGRREQADQLRAVGTRELGCVFD
jgi:hypothetical protein